MQTRFVGGSQTRASLKPCVRSTDASRTCASVTRSMHRSCPTVTGRSHPPSLALAKNGLTALSGSLAHAVHYAACKGAIVALALRIALWVIVLLVPGGVLALPLLVAQHTRKVTTNHNGATDTQPGDLVGPVSQT